MLFEKEVLCKKYLIFYIVHHALKEEDWKIYVVQKVISAQNLFTRKLFAVYTLHRFASFGILQFIARKLENTVNIISSFQEIHIASLYFTYFRSQKNFA